MDFTFVPERPELKAFTVGEDLHCRSCVIIIAKMGLKGDCPALIGYVRDDPQKNIKEFIWDSEKQVWSQNSY